jgi:hypothetical protein
MLRRRPSAAVELVLQGWSDIIGKKQSPGSGRAEGKGEWRAGEVRLSRSVDRGGRCERGYDLSAMASRTESSTSRRGRVASRERSELRRGGVQGSVSMVSFLALADLCRPFVLPLPFLRAWTAAAPGRAAADPLAQLSTLEPLPSTPQTGSISPWRARTLLPWPIPQSLLGMCLRNRATVRMRARSGRARPSLRRVTQGQPAIVRVRLRQEPLAPRPPRAAQVRRNPVRRPTWTSLGDFEAPVCKPSTAVDVLA